MTVIKMSYRGIEVNTIKHSEYYEVYSDDGFVNEIMNKADFKKFIKCL